VPSEKTKGREERGKRALYRHRLSWKRQGIKGIKEGRERLLRAGETVTGVVNARKKRTDRWGRSVSGEKRRNGTGSGEEVSGPRARSGAGPDCFPRGLFFLFVLPSFLFLFFLFLL
jgi:hypothetical protein